MVGLIAHTSSVEGLRALRFYVSKIVMEVHRSVVGYLGYRHGDIASNRGRLGSYHVLQYLASRFRRLD